MQHHTIKVFPKTADVTLLRFLSPEGKLIGERELDLSEIERLAAGIELKYHVVSIGSETLTALGRELYEWLDGPAHRWLAGVITAPRWQHLSLFQRAMAVYTSAFGYRTEA
jgi:hypothetical protein